jgi:hypothetical protein
MSQQTKPIKQALNTERMTTAAKALVMYKANLFSLAVAAALSEMTEGELIALANDPQFERLAEAEYSRMVQSGDLQRIRSKGALNRVLDMIDSRLDAEEMPVGVLLKSGEFLHRVSGIEQERAAELRFRPEENPGFGVVYAYEGEEPDVSGKGHGLIIRFPGPRPVDEKVIGGGAA